MKPRVIFTAILLFIFCNSFSQEVPVAILSSVDVDRYIETVVPMSKELNELGDAHRGNEENPGEMWVASAEARAILEKYGWNESFALKFSAITWAYTYLKIMQEIDKMPEDQKVQAEQMMPMLQLYTSKVHQDDLKIVEGKLDEIDLVFKDLEKL
ncbi:MAG TPA: hypothetical protein DCX54_01415 [Flavobacteriales bacterium]|nr:hypothetical protein [Flavobacteriales bacterium]